MNPSPSSNGVLKLQTNSPEIIALAFAQGREVTSSFGGDQIMFTLVDGRRFYTSPYVASKIYEADIPARTPFAICKREVTHGNRRSVEYQIETHNEEAGALSESAPAVTTTPTPAQQLSKVPATQAQTAAAPNSNNGAPPSTTPPARQIAAADPENTPETAAMIRAHKMAIDVAVAAEAYASAQGLAIRYAAEDIRAVAACLYINATKGAR